MSAPAPIGILLSGRGSNFLALAESMERGELPARIVVVGSNKPEAQGLTLARERGLPTFAIRRRKGMTREEHEERMLAELEPYAPEWICLAGYMRRLSPTFIERYPGRILNIHPSLLPAFPGLDAQEQAFAHGVRIAGCTVHLVDDGVDTGPIVLQRSVEVRDGDGVEAMKRRILEQEHRAYPAALKRLLTEHWATSGRRIEFEKPLA